MKIVFIDEAVDKVGGVERIISTLANRLSKKNDVMVISEYKTSNTTFYKYENSIQIKYLIDNQKNNVNRKNTNVFFNFVSRAKNKLRKILKIQNAIKTNLYDADVIVFGRVYTALDFLPYIKRNKITAKIIVRDAIHIENYSEVVRKNLYKYFNKLVDTFIISSDESMNAYKDFFGDIKRIQLKKIYNPLGIEPKGNFNYSNKVVVSIGRMDMQKGFENLISAFAIVHKKHPEWVLKIYGDGEYKENIEKHIREIQIAEGVNLLPTTKDVVKVLNESSIFVMTSRFEGYANMLVEAMACGMPVISYDWLMGVEDIIDDKENGIIVRLKDRMNYFKGGQSEEDISNLAEAINLLIENEALCERISKKAKQIVSSRSQDLIISKWEEIITN